MRMVTKALMLGIFMVSFLQAQMFTRVDSVNIENPLTENIGGIGNFIAGEDIDGDGLTEIYMVNDNWGDDTATKETIPQIYKYERSATGEWLEVWKAVVPTALVDYQNTWPPLAIGDLDKDGKKELIWGVVNSTGTLLNPARIVVYEHAGGDNFGVDNAGDWEPNASWTITTEDSKNIRPVRWEIVDIDSDGVDEIVFADRKGNDAGYYYGICSVDDIPDTGDGSETWTMESSGLDFGLTSLVENKFDMVVVGANAYFFSEAEISKISWSGTAYTYTGLDPLATGSTWNSATAVDINDDGKLEIIAASYDWGDDTKKGVYILEELGDTLQATKVVDLVPYWPSGSRGASGGSVGDIDGDGYIDYVFGGRAATPQAAIFRCEYQGGDMLDAGNWELNIIDQEYAVVDTSDGGIWNLVQIVNMDDDAELEVLYTSSSSVSYSKEFLSTSVSAPIVVLDAMGTSSIEERKVAIADDYRLKQNYPNPFNPSTTITFHIPQNEVANLTVYDMQGREVATLLSKSLAAGSYDLTWSGLDNHGNQVASGMYIYTLSTSSFKESKRMILLK